MDDFLYIILGIAWLAFSLYTNKQKLDKKRAEREAQMRRGTPQNHNIDDEYQRTDDEYHKAEEDYHRAEDMPRRVETHRKHEQTHRRPEEEYVPLPKKTLFDELFGDQPSVIEDDEEESYIPEVNEHTWQKRMAEYANVEAASMEEIKDEVPADYFTRQYAEVYKTADQRVINSMPDYEEEEHLMEVQEDFDVKKAVIYATILRAPYVSQEF